MGASLSCLDPVQDQSSYTLGRKHVGRAESIAEYKARANADKHKLLKKSVVVPPPAPVERSLPKEVPEKKLSEVTTSAEESPEKIQPDAEKEKLLPEKPDVLVEGPFEVDEKAQKTLPNDDSIIPSEPEIAVAGSTDEIIPQEQLSKDIIIPAAAVAADDTVQDQDPVSVPYKEAEKVYPGATQGQENKSLPLPDPKSVRVSSPVSSPVIKPRPVSNVSEVPEFPDIDDTPFVSAADAEAMFAEKSYAHPELEMEGTKVQDPVTGMLVTVGEYRSRQSQRSGGLVKEYVSMYEQIDEATMKEKEVIEKQKIARISQRGDVKSK